MRYIPFGTAAKITKNSREKRMLNKVKRKRTMKTYKTKKCLGRLSAYLIAMMKPFNFDGRTIEFMATPEFIKRMGWDDILLGQIDFEIF